MPLRTPPAASDSLPMLLDPILKAILTETASDAAGLYAVTDRKWLASVPIVPLPEIPLPLESADPVVLRETELAGSAFLSAVLFPLETVEGQMLILAVFSNSGQSYSTEDAERLKSWSYPITALLENRSLREQREAAHKIQAAVRVMHDAVLPQEIVDRLHPFSQRVSTCAILLYGPLREDMPGGPFEYLEVRGTWSKRRGSGIGTSIRIFLDAKSERLLEQINEKRVLAVDPFKTVKAQLEPLIFALMRAEHVRSMVLLPIGTPEWPVGVMMIATDELTPFSEQEISTFQVIGELVTLNSLTTLLQMHHQLVQQKHSALLDAVTDGVIIVVPEVGGQANSEGFVSSINKAFADLFAVSQAEVEGLTLSELLERMHLPEDKTTVLLQQWSKIMVRSPETQRGELEIARPDRDTVNLEWYSAPVYQDRRIQGRIYIFHDTSAEHTAERLRANFIQRLSHELRTPLSSIQGYAQLLLDQASLGSHERKHVHTIFENALRLNEMFTDVILIARADNRELHLQMKFVLLSDLVYNAARMLEDKARARGIAIEFLLDDKLPYVYIDSHYISQTLEEILRNAVLYTPANSRIHIKASLVTDISQLPYGAPGDLQLLPYVLLTVADEGAGFTVEEAENVFVPFYRGKNATSAKIPGTGLGLTIARSLIELHRGKIWAEPRRRGKHTTRFHFILPAIEPETH